MSDDAITWIHLSDFHAGQRGGAVWNQVDAELRESVEQMAAVLGRPDVVLFTGDLANRGAADEYAAVDQLLDRIGAWLGGEVPVFAVPGNHDVVRPGKADAWRYSGLLRYDEHPEIVRSRHRVHPSRRWARWRATAAGGRSRAPALHPRDAEHANASGAGIGVV
jgi:predicted MPP superfamily phosphohydrolase